MSRHAWRTVAAFLLLPMANTALAQDELSAQQGEPPQRIDILAKPAEDDAPLEDCSAEQEAASISGEIVVCRRRRDQTGERYSSSEEAERRYAAETMDKDSPRPPDLFGITHQGVTVARGCFIGPCPPPPAYIIDIEALPEAPPGSDADRIARGLAPKGGEATDSQAVASELGLPPASKDAVNPSESASPKEAP